MVQFFDIEHFEEQVRLCKDLNRHQLKNEQLKQIHPDVHVYYNSLNLLCGPQGSGKTFTACKEIAKIMQVDPYAHMLIVVCKSENSTDPTVSTFAQLFPLPVKYIADEIARHGHAKTVLRSVPARNTFFLRLACGRTPRARTKHRVVSLHFFMCRVISFHFYR